MVVVFFFAMVSLLLGYGSPKPTLFLTTLCFKNHRTSCQTTQSVEIKVIIYEKCPDS